MLTATECLFLTLIKRLEGQGTGKCKGVLNVKLQDRLYFVHSSFLVIHVRLLTTILTTSHLSYILYNKMFTTSHGNQPPKRPNYVTHKPGLAKNKKQKRLSTPEGSMYINTDCLEQL